MIKKKKSHPYPYLSLIYSFFSSLLSFNTRMLNSFICFLRKNVERSYLMESTCWKCRFRLGRWTRHGLAVSNQLQHFNLIRHSWNGQLGYLFWHVVRRSHFSYTFCFFCISKFSIAHKFTLPVLLSQSLLSLLLFLYLHNGSTITLMVKTSKYRKS